MAGRQRIFVVSTTAGASELLDVRTDLGRAPVVLVAPTPEASQVTRTLGVDARTESLLAPPASRDAALAHQVDALVRRHAMDDRFRDVVVVADAETSLLLVNALAPGASPTASGVTVVGLPRGHRRVPTGRAVALGVVLGVVIGLVEPAAPALILLGSLAVAGLVLMLVGSLRAVAEGLLIAAGIAGLVLIAMIAGSARFPGAW